MDSQRLERIISEKLLPIYNKYYEMLGIAPPALGLPEHLVLEVKNRRVPAIFKAKVSTKI